MPTEDRDFARDWADLLARRAQPLVPAVVGRLVGDLLDEVRRLRARVAEGEAGATEDHGIAEAVLDAIARDIDDGMPWLVSSPLRAAAAEVRAIRAERDALWARVADLERDAAGPTIPDCPSIVATFAELADLVGDAAGLDDVLAEKEAERQGRHDLAAVLVTPDDRILGFEDDAGCLEFLRADPSRVRVMWLRAAFLGMAREWLETPPAGEVDATRGDEEAT